MAIKDFIRFLLKYLDNAQWSSGHAFGHLWKSSREKKNEDEDDDYGDGGE